MDTGACRHHDLPDVDPGRGGRFRGLCLADQMKTCIYCKFPAQCRDHVPPRAWESVYRTKKKKGTVPSCFECNQLLGSVPIFTVEERIEYLRERYEIRGAQWLVKPDCSAKELSLLPFVVQTEVRAGLGTREYYRNKLRNLGIPQLEEFVIQPEFESEYEPEPEPEPESEPKCRIDAPCKNCRALFRRPRFITF